MSISQDLGMIGKHYLKGVCLYPTDCCHNVVLLYSFDISPDK